MVVAMMGVRRRLSNLFPEAVRGLETYGLAEANGAVLRSLTRSRYAPDHGAARRRQYPLGD